MDDTVPVSRFDESYQQSAPPPWVIGEQQPVFHRLEQDGLIRGSVLDAGCGTGEHTIALTRLGYSVRGIDASPAAIDAARANAAEHGVAADFAVEDALDLGTEQRYDTVLDSALFHVFGPDDQRAYSRSLHAVCRPNAVVHLLALSDAEDASGPRISDSMIRAAFTEGWRIEDLRASTYRGQVLADDEEKLGLRTGEITDTAAWLARIRRL